MTAPSAMPMTSAAARPIDRDASVEDNLGAERQVLGAEARPADACRRRRREAQQPADHGEQRRFHDELDQHAIAAGADRLPDRELFRPRAHPDHQEVGQIDDANRQQHEGAGLHEEQRAADRRRRDVRAAASRSIGSRRQPSSFALGLVRSIAALCASTCACASASVDARLQAGNHVGRAAPVPAIGTAILRAGVEREIQARLRGQESIVAREGRQPPCAGIR